MTTEAALREARNGILIRLLKVAYPHIAESQWRALIAVAEKEASRVLALAPDAAVVSAKETALREALEPFAKASEDLVLSPNTRIPDSASITVFFDSLGLTNPWRALTVGDFRRARAALAPDPTVVEVRLETDAVRDVLAERERQKAVEGWTAAHDDDHSDGEMAAAAACYASLGSISDKLIAEPGSSIRGWWPLGRSLIEIGQAHEIMWPRGWARKWWKPSGARRNLVKAGALILAEIERLDRDQARAAVESAARAALKGEG